MAFPTKAKYVIIGAGIHGLSTAWHLAEKIKKNGNGSNNDIVVIDKGGISSGASGIACGVVRNNYFQPAMRELMAHSVNVWESDPKKFSYHPVGYMQISPESMREDVTTISLFEPFPFFLIFSAKCQAVLKPCIPAPITTYFAFLGNDIFL